MSNSPILACSKVITTHGFESKHPVSVYAPHRGLINCATFNHTNKVIASSGQDGRIVLVSAQQKQKILAEFSFDSKKQTYPPSVNCCLFSPGSKYIAAGSSDSLVKVWAMNNHKEVFLTVKNHTDSISALAWTKNEEIMASSSFGGSIFLHSIKTGKAVEQIVLKPQEGISCIRISEGADYCRLAASTEAGSIKIWDVDASRTCKPISSFQNANKISVSSLSFSTFNPVLMVTSSLDQNLTFYDISQKKAVKTIATEQPLTAVNFHHDGHTLLAGGMYGGLFIYDLRKPHKPKQKLIGHETQIKYIDFHRERQSHTHPPNPNKESRQQSMPNASNPSTTSQQQSRVTKTMSAVSVNKLPKGKMEESEESQQALKKEQSQKSSSKQIGYRQSELPPSTAVSNAYINKRQELGSIPVATTITTTPPPIQNNFTQEKPSLIREQQPMNDSFQQLRIKLEDSVAERFEMLHLEIIRQFQIQQQQLKSLIQKSSEETRMKDHRIKQLQEEIARMKKNRY